MHQNEVPMQDNLVISIRKSLQPEALVFVQSNVKDVATYIFEQLTAVHVENTYQMIPVGDAKHGSSDIGSIQQPNTWLQGNPFLAQSETEAVTSATGKTVWRCLLKAI